MKLFRPIKIITRLYVCFVMTFIILMPRSALAFPPAGFEWPDFTIAVTTMYDPVLLGTIGAAWAEALLITGQLDRIEAKTKESAAAANIYSKNTEKIDNAVTAELKATTDWIEKTKPNIAYQNQLEKLKNDLNTAELISDKKLSDIELAYFTTTYALENMSKVYGKNNSAYKKVLYSNSVFDSDKPDNPFCPPVLANTPGIVDVSYGTLQRVSCQTIYNATAYKEEVNNILANKDRIIDDSTNNTLNGIIKLPSKTIGDYNARQTALETVRLLRKVAMNDNDIKLHNAETEIEIAQHEKKYAVNSILTGPPKSASVDATINGIKVALGTSVGLLGTAVAPYNQ
jgi:hypothetical protein